MKKLNVALIGVVGMKETLIRQRPAEAKGGQLSTMLTAQASASKMVDMDVDDTTAFLARFADGAVGTFESTRFEVGLENEKVFEAVTRSIADERWVAVSESVGQHWGEYR